MMITVLDILLLALVVAAIWKLRSVLGRRTGFERTAESEQDIQAPKIKQASAKQNLLDVMAQKEKDNEHKEIIDDGAKDNLDAIARADKNFTLQNFMRGARIAYGLIIEAFAAGDMDRLKNLVKKNVAMRFQAEIERRANNNHLACAKLVKITSARIMAAALEKGEAKIIVEMKSSQIAWTKDEEGRIIAGDPNTPRDMKDVWVFSRDVVHAEDPNWLLAATSAGA